MDLVKEKNEFIESLSRASAQQSDNYLDIDFSEEIWGVKYQNIYTDGAMDYTQGDEAITAGGMFFGEKSALNLSISYGFHLSSIFEAELFTIFYA